jgi:hypothetical protein
MKHFWSIPPPPLREGGQYACQQSMLPYSPIGQAIMLFSSLFPENNKKQKKVIYNYTFSHCHIFFPILRLFFF